QGARDATTMTRGLLRSLENLRRLTHAGWPTDREDLSSGVSSALCLPDLEAFYEEGALDLASGRSAGELVDDGQPARLLERCEAAGAERPERVEAGCGAVVADDDHRSHHLAPFGVGDADHRNFGDRRMAGEHLFHLRWRDRLATGADDVAGA